MALSRKTLVVACMFLLLVLVPKGSMGRQHQSLSLADSFFPSMVENMLLDCGLHLNDIKEIIKNLDFLLLNRLVKDSRKIYVKTGLLSEDSEGEVVSPLSPHLERYFLECLNRQNHPADDSGGENYPRNHYYYLEPLLGSYPASRRNLADQPSQTVVPADAPDSRFFPSEFGEMSADTTPTLSHSIRSSPHSTQTLLEKEQQDIHKMVVIAVVSSVAGTSFVAALIFILYNTCNRSKDYSCNTLRDDRPLLVNLGNFSGSSQNSFGTSNSSEKNKLGAFSLKDEPIQVGNPSFLDVGSVDVPPSKLYSGLHNSSIELSDAFANGQSAKPTEGPAGGVSLYLDPSPAERSTNGLAEGHINGLGEKYEPAERYTNEPGERYINGLGERYINGTGEIYISELGQRYINEPGERYTNGGPGERYTNGGPGERYTNGEPGEIYVNRPGQRYNNGEPGERYTNGEPGEIYVNRPGERYTNGEPGERYPNGEPAERLTNGEPGERPTNGEPAEKPACPPPPPPPQSRSPAPPPLPPAMAPPVPEIAPASIPSPPLPNKNPDAPLPPLQRSAGPPRPPQSSPSSRAPRPAPPGPKFPSSNDDAPKTKLKPFFWDKVLANPDQAMVWNQIKAGSFQFDEEMIESLFGYTSASKPKNGGKESLSKAPAQYVRILDAKKSQNLAISLKALNVKIEEVRDALMEGNELPVELLQVLLKMAPTSDEELRLRLYTGDLSELGIAEQFLKSLLEIPFAFQRLDVLLFMASLPEEISSAEESFSTLEVACGELKTSRLFRKLLEAVLKTGNRMNDGTYRGGAQAFKLDTLLKLADVKGADGKTTLLHFVVREIIRSEGVRAVRMARERSGSICSVNSDDFTDDSLHESEDYFRKLGLKVVSGLGDELQNVKKAATLDADALTTLVANLGQRLETTKEFLNTSMKSLEEESGFHHSLKCFVEKVGSQVTFFSEDEQRIRSLVKQTTDFFHGNAGKDEGLRLFVIVRDFIVILDKACKEVREEPRKVKQAPKNKEISPSSPVPEPLQQIFPAIRDRRVDSSSSSSSDDES